MRTRLAAIAVAFGAVVLVSGAVRSRPRLSCPRPTPAPARTLPPAGRAVAVRLTAPLDARAALETLDAVRSGDWRGFPDFVARAKSMPVDELAAIARDDDDLVLALLALSDGMGPDLRARLRAGFEHRLARIVAAPGPFEDYAIELAGLLGGDALRETLTTRYLADDDPAARAALAQALAAAGDARTAATMRAALDRESDLGDYVMTAHVLRAAARRSGAAEHEDFVRESCFREALRRASIEPGSGDLLPGIAALADLDVAALAAREVLPGAFEPEFKRAVVLAAFETADEREAPLWRDLLADHGADEVVGPALEMVAEKAAQTPCECND